MQIMSILAIVPLAVISLQSYSDFNRTIQSDVFDYNGAIIYMESTGLIASADYTVRYYDGSNTLVLTDSVQSDANGRLLSQIQPSLLTSAIPGNWQAKLYKGGSLKATDTFSVTGNAIPEFPSLVVVPIAGVCFMVYKIMKKKARK